MTPERREELIAEFVEGWAMTIAHGIEHPIETRYFRYPRVDEIPEAVRSAWRLAERRARAVLILHRDLLRALPWEKPPTPAKPRTLHP